EDGRRRSRGVPSGDRHGRRGRARRFRASTPPCGHPSGTGAPADRPTGLLPSGRARGGPPSGATSRLERCGGGDMRWATRASVHVDRAACAWLIRRIIDPEADFVFVDDTAEVPADATPFDMRGVELSHHGGDCSFETILHRYGLDD